MTESEQNHYRPLLVEVVDWSNKRVMIEFEGEKYPGQCISMSEDGLTAKVKYDDESFGEDTVASSALSKGEPKLQGGQRLALNNDEEELQFPTDSRVNVAYSDGQTYTATVLEDFGAMGVKVKFDDEAFGEEMIETDQVTLIDGPAVGTESWQGHKVVHYDETEDKTYNGFCIADNGTTAS
eukprot:UN25694